MASQKNVYGLCDTCGFRYKLNQLKKNSYGMMVCPTDWDGSFNIQNHPQNKSPRIDERAFIRDIRPDPNTDRNGMWQAQATAFEQTLKFWNLI
tara:strand:+ start:626 stop:904 length:279 start_codon:yes stop_codon:yes gene_type:complete